MDPTAEILFNYLRDAIYNPNKARLDMETLPEGFHDLAKGLMYYVNSVQEVTNMAKALSKGDLRDVSASPDNEMAAPLKALCASLRHLTWQTQQVAHGDYNQRVNFMGEFATSFNIMVEQLILRQKSLMEEIDHGNKKMVALEQGKQLLEAIAGRLAQWVIVIDRKDKTLYYSNHTDNEAPADMEFKTRVRKWFEQQLETAKPVPRTEELELNDNEIFQVEIHSLQWQGQEAMAFIMTDVSAGRAHLKKLEGIAYLDPLTMTYNRRYGMDLLTSWLKERKSFALCFVDIDNLKYVNDKFGHNEGDFYILSVANILRQFSNSAVVCRLGGDEFMLLLAEWNEEMAEKRMEELQNRLAEGASEYFKSISYGVVAVGENNELPREELMRIVDKKMYAYKKNHKVKPKPQ